MITKLVTEFDSFAAHHQILVAIMIIAGVVLVSWGVENIIERYIFPHKPLYGYIGAIAIGLFLLIMAKHFILRVI